MSKFVSSDLSEGIEQFDPSDYHIEGLSCIKWRQQLYEDWAKDIAAEGRCICDAALEATRLRFVKDVNWYISKYRHKTHFVYLKTDEATLKGKLKQGMDWCETNIGPCRDKWIINEGANTSPDHDQTWVFLFVERKDAMLFKLSMNW